MNTKRLTALSGILILNLVACGSGENPVQQPDSEVQSQDLEKKSDRKYTVTREMPMSYGRATVEKISLGLGPNGEKGVYSKLDLKVEHDCAYKVDYLDYKLSSAKTSDGKSVIALTTVLTPEPIFTVCVTQGSTHKSIYLLGEYTKESISILNLRASTGTSPKENSRISRLTEVKFGSIKEACPQPDFGSIMCYRGGLDLFVKVGVPCGKQLASVATRWNGDKLLVSGTLYSTRAKDEAVCKTDMSYRAVRVSGTVRPLFTDSDLEILTESASD